MEIEQFIQDYFQKMKSIQELLLEFLENEDSQEANFQNLIKKIDDLKIKESKYDLKILLHMISKIANYHKYLSKIEQILKAIAKEIKQSFSNLDIFNIFKDDKLILLFLLNEKIIIPDKTISNIISNGKYKILNYHVYFQKEFKKFYSKSLLEKMENDQIYDNEQFEKKRKIGENDSYICELIRNDSIDEFIAYVNQTNFDLSKTIDWSPFETNTFLLKGYTSLIEYAAFFGSMQIFQYLRLNGVCLTERLWLYSIHSKSSEMIHCLEENQVETYKRTFKECIEEAIKCHHNDIAQYFIENHTDSKSDFVFKCLESYNFIELFETKDNDSNFLFDLNDETKKDDLFCILSKIDCFVIVDFLLKNGNIKINQKSIHWHFFSFKYFIFQLFDDVLYCLFIFVMGYMNH